MGESSNGIQHQYAVVDYFLKLCCGLAAIMRSQIGFATHIDGMQANRYSQFVGGCGLKRLDGLRSVLAAQGELRLQSRH